MKDVSFSPTFFNRDEDIYSEEEGREVITFALSDDEILKLAKATAELDIEHRTVDAHFAMVKKDFKGKLDGLASQMNHNFRLIKDQAEDRDVDCIKRKNFTRKVVQFIYNGKVCKERAMADHEMTNPKLIQGSLNGGSTTSL
jgi:hypothetical protein